MIEQLAKIALWRVTLFCLYYSSVVAFRLSAFCLIAPPVGSTAEPQQKLN